MTHGDQPLVRCHIERQHGVPLNFTAHLAGISEQRHLRGRTVQKTRVNSGNGRAARLARRHGGKLHGVTIVPEMDTVNHVEFIAGGHGFTGGAESRFHQSVVQVAVHDMIKPGIHVIVIQGKFAIVFIRIHDGGRGQPFEVAGAGTISGFFPGFVQCRQQHGGKDGDDRNTIQLKMPENFAYFCL